MDLKKILEKKELEAKDGDNSRAANYAEEHPDKLVGFRDYGIPRDEYLALEEISSQIGENINSYEVKKVDCWLRELEFFSGKSLRVNLGDNHITELQIISYKLNQIPEPAYKLKELQKLDLYRNQITSLPEEIGIFEQLEDLNLNMNPLKNLPESIVNLRKLKILNISNIKHLDFRSRKLAKSLKKRGVYVGNFELWV